MGKNYLPVSQQAYCCLPLDAGILYTVGTLAVGCGLLALLVTGEIWDWQLAVMGMLARRGDSTRTFLALTTAEVTVLVAGIAMYAASALKTYRMRQWGVWGEPELEQMRKQLRPSGIITAMIVVMWLVRVFAWVPIVCDLEYELAIIRCRDMGYPEDGEGWDNLRGREGCALLEPAWWHHGASQGAGMCHWQPSSGVNVNGTCELDMSVTDNTVPDCESTRRLEEGAARLPLLLLGAYHVYLVHIHTIAVAGIGTVSESMIKEPTATGTSSSAIAAP